MDITIENILLVGSILLFVSILAGKTSFRLGIPTLVFFLAIGMLAGSEGIGGIFFDDSRIARFIGVIALNFILFAGGIETNWTTVKPVFWHGISLSTLGVLFTTIFVGLFVWAITNFNIYESLLFGAIVSSTDAAAVFSVLRSKNIALKSNLRPLLELESGSNDPFAYLLTIIFLDFVTNAQLSFWVIIPLVLKQLLIGGFMGLSMGFVAKQIINKIKLDYEGLYPVLSISLLLFTFSFTDFIGGNGFLSVYLSAIYLGNQHLIHKKTIVKMFDGLAWLMQIILFLTLGLLVFPSQILPVMGIGLLISAFLMFAARPLSVFLSLSFFKMKNRERLFVSWVGLRGAVPIVFATYPLIAGIDKANIIFNIVFFVSLSSVLVQGSTLSIIAKWLHVSLPARAKQVTPVDIMLGESLGSEFIEIEIPAENCVVGKRIVDLGFPDKALITLIQRDGRYITPNGFSVIQPLDKLIVVAENKENLKSVFQCLNVDE